jgi:hypothetical protein
MIKQSFFIVLMTLVWGCKKKEFPANPPNLPVDLKKDSLNSINNSSTSLKNQTWIINAYKIGELGLVTNRLDTLKFLNTYQYLYNKDTSTYNLYPSQSTYTLTLNGTFLGNLAGTIYSYNLKNGKIEGLQFKDITIGSSNNAVYYLWLYKL